MTERRIYQKLNDLGYSNNAQRTNPKSGCTEEEEVAIFNFLLPKYDSAFALGDWLSTDERKTTILRYMKNLGLAHHFHGKAQQVGAAECKQENWQAIAELIQKLEKRHGADALYEDKENHSRGAAVRKNGGGGGGCSSIQDQHAESLHMPATRQRALGIKEVESLALDEVAKKMTGRRAASLGRTELAYIVEVHHAQMKDKLAEKQKQVEKQTKRQQCEEEFALEQLKMNIAKLENTLIKAERSPSAGSHAEKLPNVKRLTEELKALKKQHMAMLMQAGLAEEEIKKKAEVLRQKERAIDHLAKREQAKLTQRNSDGDKATTASAARAAVRAPTSDERYVADERKPKPALAVPNSSEPQRSDAKISKVVVLNTGATRSDESPSTSGDELEERQEEKRARPAAAAARTTTASGAAVKPKRSQIKEAKTKTDERESKPRTVRATAKRREQAEERSTTTKRQQPREAEKLQRDDERLLKKCEKERRAMKEGQRLPRINEVLKGWGGSCLPPQQHEHHFLDRLNKERRKRVKQMRSDAVRKVKERRKSRTSAIGGTDEAAAIIVVKDTPWATKRKKKASATASAGKPVRGRLTFADTESEDDDEDDRRCTGTTIDSNDDDTSSSSSSEEEDDNEEVDAITEGCDESDGDGNGDDLIVEMWDDGHGEEGEYQAAGSSDEDDGKIVEPPRDEGISKVSATVILNIGPAERSGRGSGERRPNEFPHDNEVDEGESESENDDDDDDEESDEESEPEAEVLGYLRKARKEWRWQRDRPERERVEGKRRTAEKRRSQGRKNDERRKSEKRKEQRELDEVVSTDGGEGRERGEHQRAKMKALVAEYLRDLAEPVTDLTRLEEGCAEPPSEEIQQLQALVAVFEARARNRAAGEVALDEDLLRMSLEEKKRALWGDNYHADNIKWAIAQQQQRQAQNGADKAATATTAGVRRS